MDQYYALSGRKRNDHYSDVIRAEAPIAKQAYFDDKGLKLQNEQFDKNLKLQKDVADQEENQANTANAIAAGGLALDTASLFKDSYLCGATNIMVGLSEGCRDMLAKLYRFTLKRHNAIGRYYMEHGYKLVKSIDSSVSDCEKFYKNLKQTMIMPVTEKIRSGDMEEAYLIYKEKCAQLFKDFSPELYAGIPNED